MGPWEELLNATIRGALPISTFTPKEAEGGTGVGMGVRVGVSVAVGVGSWAIVDVGLETIPGDGVGSAGVTWEDAVDAPGDSSDVAVEGGS